VAVNTSSQTNSFIVSITAGGIEAHAAGFVRISAADLSPETASYVALSIAYRLSGRHSASYLRAAESYRSVLTNRTSFDHAIRHGLYRYRFIAYVLVYAISDAADNVPRIVPSLVWGLTLTTSGLSL